MTSHNIPAEHFDRLFNPLVGTQEDYDVFRSRLSLGVRQRNDGEDPYTVLRAHVMGAMHEVIDNAVCPDYEDPHRGVIKKNGDVGAGLTTAALRAVGTIYQSEAGCPQALSNVTKSARGAVRYLAGLARGDKETSTANLMKLMNAADPNGNAAESLVTAKGRWVDFRGAFRARVISSDGQMLVVPHIRLLKSPTKNRCPAAKSEVEVGRRKDSALVRVMDCMADVAVRDIYPGQFAIHRD